MVSEFTARTMASNPEEAAIVKRLIRRLAANGTPITRVHDGEDMVSTPTTDDVLDAVFSVDFSRVYTATGSWVQLVAGNGEDMIADYTTSLEGVI